MRIRSICAAVLAASACMSAAASAATISVFANAADGRVRDNGPAYDGLGNSANEISDTTRRNGHFSGGNEDDFLVYPFQLPDRGGNAITSATVSLFYNVKVGSPNFNGILTGLTRTNASPTILASDYEAAGTVLDSAFTTPASAAGQYVNNTGAALVNFLNNAYTTVGTGGYVFFRVSHVDAVADGGTGLPLNTAYEFRMSEFAGTDGDPLLTFTTVPEPASLGLAGVALGMLSLRRRRATTRA